MTAAWPLTHNWSFAYSMTLSYKTTVLTSQSGREQRIAERFEPRRSITTAVLEDARSAQTFDRFLWTQQASLFTHADPVNGYTSLVRLDDQQSVTHPGAHVAVSSVVMSVEPGTDSLTYDVTEDALYALGGRHVFPFPVNWTAGRADALTIPRRVADFDRGVIAVSRPVSFATRAGTVLLLRVGADEVNALTGFFGGMLGRQGEFWSESLLDDMDVVEIVSNTLEVDGADAAAMFGADTVNAAVTLYSYSGGVYRRRVLSAGVSGQTTFLQLDSDVPEQPTRWRRCSWAQVSRFASDDLTVQWTTNEVAQAQVQVQSLPYAASETTLTDNTLTEYYGTLVFPFSDLFDYMVNTQTPLASEWPDSGDTYANSSDVYANATDVYANGYAARANEGGYANSTARSNSTAVYANG